MKQLNISELFSRFDPDTAWEAVIASKGKLINKCSNSDKIDFDSFSEYLSAIALYVRIPLGDNKYVDYNDHLCTIKDLYGVLKFLDLRTLLQTKYNFNNDEVSDS